MHPNSAFRNDGCRILIPISTKAVRGRRDLSKTFLRLPTSSLLGCSTAACQVAYLSVHNLTSSQGATRTPGGFSMLQRAPIEAPEWPPKCCWRLIWRFHGKLGSFSNPSTILDNSLHGSTICRPIPAFLRELLGIPRELLGSPQGLLGSPRELLSSPRELPGDSWKLLEAGSSAASARKELLRLQDRYRDRVANCRSVTFTLAGSRRCLVKRPTVPFASFRGSKTFREHVHGLVDRSDL